MLFEMTAFEIPPRPNACVRADLQVHASTTVIACCSLKTGVGVLNGNLLRTGHRAHLCY